MIPTLKELAAMSDAWARRLTAQTGELHESILLPVMAASADVRYLDILAALPGASTRSRRAATRARWRYLGCLREFGLPEVSP